MNKTWSWGLLLKLFYSKWDKAKGDEEKSKRLNLPCNSLQSVGISPVFLFIRTLMTHNYRCPFCYNTLNYFSNSSTNMLSLGSDDHLFCLPCIKWKLYPKSLSRCGVIMPALWQISQQVCRDILKWVSECKLNDGHSVTKKGRLCPASGCWYAIVDLLLVKLIKLLSPTYCVFNIIGRNYSYDDR